MSGSGTYAFAATPARNPAGAAIHPASMARTNLHSLAGFQTPSNSGKLRRNDFGFLREVGRSARRCFSHVPAERSAASWRLLDERLHLFEQRVLGRTQPLESHHLGCHQLGAVAGEPVKSCVAVALGA